ncbi:MULTISPECIES: DUF2514 family protein [pseudomallei group]|nr:MULTISPECIES: DUF2514 family protein [pseudomallei group]UYE89880.1 tail assembly chaperone [Burkholderia phage PhiBt-E264.1]MBF3887209.1 DUF2514 family protein [Burkholderia pseudomallei]MBF3893857.1 DUF2514 family protein [Burkholderia pseudomallei]NBC93534.1 DUF2514 family protein [Burkholderia thailandensis]PHH34170.1 DUF2514 domain-containing protein [Burkholderia thailandensis]
MTWLDLRVWFAIVAAVVIGSAAGYFKGHRDADQSRTVETQAQRIRELVVERDESDRIARQQQGNAENAAKQREQARAAADAADAAANSLRKQVAELVAGMHDPGAPAGSAAAGGALDLLADLFGRADEAAGEFARIADDRGVAGRQCESDYDALTAAVPR